MSARREAHTPGAVTLSMQDDGDGLALMMECETPAQACEGGPITLRIMENTENDRSDFDEEEDEQEKQERDATVLLSVCQRDGKGPSTEFHVALSVADLDAFVTNLTTLRDQARAAGILAGVGIR